MKLVEEKLDGLYLHAGTRTGARLLLQKRLGDTLEYKDLPFAFRKLPYEDLKNLFCICKNLLDSSISDHEFQKRYREFEINF